MDGAAQRFLPYGRQLIDEEDIAAVAAVLRSPYLTTGPAVAAFEAALAEETGAPHAISCANGTAALHLACAALGIGPGDAAIVPSITFLATANAVRMQGAEVVFADVDPDTGLMRPDHFLEAVRRAALAGLKPKLVLPVHLAGQCDDLPAIGAAARLRGISVIEDACHALGSLYMRKDGFPSPVGACRDSDMTVFSFHPVKTIAAGEGGAVTVADPILASRIARLRSHGMVREPQGFSDAGMAFDENGEANPWYYEMPELGWNYRLTDIQAALALSQLGKLDRFVGERRSLVEAYDAALSSLAPVIEPIRRSKHSHAAWHLYPVRIDFAGLGLSRAQLMRQLHDRGIGTQVHYIPVHRQPYYRRRYGLADLPGADRYYAQTLSLPLYVGLTRRDIKHIAASLADLVGARYTVAA